jgi:mitogen-activated protein kinase kinase kinase 2
MEVAYASSTSSYASSRPGNGVDKWLSRASSSGSSSLVQEIGSTNDGNAHEQTCTCACASEVVAKSFAAPRAPLNWRQGPLLGSGSFGHVFLCYDAESGADLAVKRVLLHSDHDKRVC